MEAVVLNCHVLLPRLAARILWRVDKEGGIVSDTQLISIDDLENHVSDMLPEDLKDLKVDVLNFLDYWPRYSKPHKVEDVSHVLGLVCIVILSAYIYFYVSFKHLKCSQGSSEILI